MSKVQDIKLLNQLRMVSLIEGCSTLILFFIAMPLKYMFDMPSAVSWPGRIHGVLFVLLVVMAVYAIKKISISTKLAAMLIVAAFVPFGPFWMDGKLKDLAGDSNS